MAGVYLLVFNMSLKIDSERDHIPTGVYVFFSPTKIILWFF